MQDWYCSNNVVVTKTFPGVPYFLSQVQIPGGIAPLLAAAAALSFAYGLGK